VTTNVSNRTIWAALPYRSCTPRASGGKPADIDPYHCTKLPSEYRSLLNKELLAAAQFLAGTQSAKTERDPERYQQEQIKSQFLVNEDKSI
jgi:hypothetical protein